MNTGRTVAATAKLPGATSDRWQWPRAPAADSLSANLESDDRRRVPPDGIEPVEPADEQVVQPLLRRHWIVLAKGLAGPLAVALLLFMLLAAHGGFIPATVILLIGGSVAAWVLLRWVLETVTVTDERVIVKRGVIVRDIKVIPLNKVQDVLTKQSLLGKVLGYGSVEIATAARTENEVLIDYPAPARIREQVFALVDRFQHGQAPGV